MQINITNNNNNFIIVLPYNCNQISYFHYKYVDNSSNNNNLHQIITIIAWNSSLKTDVLPDSLWSTLHIWFLSNFNSL